MKRLSKKISNVLCGLNLGDWSNIFTIVLGMTSIITAIATIRALSTQNKMQQKAQQPIFNVKYYSEDWNKDGVYDTHTIKIYNEGHIVKHIPYKNIRTFYRLDTYNDNREVKHYLFEITGFYLFSFFNSELAGEVHFAFLQNNHTLYRALCDEALNRSLLPNTYYNISKYDLIRIKYMDVEDDVFDVFYKNNIPITAENYDELSKAVGRFDVEKVKLDDLLHCINTL